MEFCRKFFVIVSFVTNYNLIKFFVREGCLTLGVMSVLGCQQYNRYNFPTPTTGVELGSEAFSACQYQHKHQHWTWSRPS